MFPKLEFTDNNLVNVIQWVKDDNIVVIYAQTSSRIFGNNSDPDLEKTRVIYINCNSFPGLVNEGEWNWYIKEAINNEVELERDTDLYLKLTKQKDVPHKEYLKLP